MELLITLVILVACAGMAAETFRGNVDDAKRTIRDTNLRALRKAIQAFYNDHGRYPYNGQDELGNVVTFLDNNTSELVQGVHDSYNHYPANPTRYLREIPVDPMTDKADWLLIPYDRDGDWKAGRPLQDWEKSHIPGSKEWKSSAGNTGGDDIDGDGKPSLMHNVPGDYTDPDGSWHFEGRPEPHVDEDGFGGKPQDEDGDGKTDEDAPDVKDVESRVP